MDSSNILLNPTLLYYRYNLLFDVWANGDDANGTDDKMIEISE